MTAVDQFSYGWITPALALVLSVLGCLLGTFLTSRSRGSTGVRRAGWLTLAAVAIGGTGTWVPHFMAMLGIDVPDAVVRYDIATTALGLGIAVVVYCLALYVVGFGRPRAWKIIPAGIVAGAGVAAVYATGPLAMRIGGTVGYEPRTLLVAAGVSIFGATVTLWCASVIRGTTAMLCASVIMAVTVCAAHYAVVAALRVEPAPVLTAVPGVSLIAMLTPVCVVACLLLAGLAYSTVGFTVRQNTATEEALLRRARDMYTVATPARTSAHRRRDRGRKGDGRKGDGGKGEGGKRERDRGAATVPSQR